ncbi:MAG: oligosaccharide flippase family protein, partial [Flammeovirgaceae bacterium]|nr:oligosaccharide flippase family protein [Flammeovirgaceae bacterium]MDW8286733.1 oligosaccharide flippase family protein [Flammeovirgaceae bacterium]
MTILKNKNIHSLANNGIVAVFGLVNFLLMARSLSQEEVGQWGIFIAGTTLLERLRTGLMQSALINYTVGTSHETSRAYHTAAWWLASLITLAVVVMVEGIAYFLDTSTHFSSFRLFFNFFSITYFATLPAYHAYWIKLATQQFLHVLLLRTITFGGFFLVLVSHYFFFPLTMREVAWAYVSCHSLSSLIAWLLRWSDWKSYLFVSLEKVKHLFQFGKYSVGSQLGEHLLKSVDSFMIGYFFSASAVAIYQVPNKIV